MKRSLIVRLALMGTAALTLSGCNDEPVPGGAFQNAEQCRTDGRYSAAACDDAFGNAQARHMAEAPRYQKREDCEAAHGAAACEVLPAHLAASAEGGTTTAATGGIFIPYMAGFLIGQMAGRSDAAILSRPLYGSAPATRGAGPGGGLHTGDGTRIAGAPGAVSVSRGVLTASPDKVTPVGRPVVQRGGFGSSGRAASVAS
ncbi:MAG: DUF1190 domain-containing protein [Alphaproteobacteria bacterium]|nr:DUF1190 domain-containing protein [Alphaproteobacteria bacterium]